MTRLYCFWFNEYKLDKWLFFLFVNNRFIAEWIFFASLKLHNENYKSHNDEKLMKFYDEKFWDIK